MATTYIVKQIRPSATTVTNLYTVTSGASAIVSSIVVTNTSSTPTTFRISVAPAGAADTTSHYLYYDVPINGNDVFIATIGFALNGVTTQDKVNVYATAATLNFTLFTAETT